MQILKRASCTFCGEPLNEDNALRCGDKLICNNMVCMELCISDSDYDGLCREFAEDICPEEFRKWIAEACFLKVDEEDLEYFEDFEPEPERDEERV